MRRNRQAIWLRRHYQGRHLESELNNEICINAYNYFDIFASSMKKSSTSVKSCLCEVYIYSIVSFNVCLDQCFVFHCNRLCKYFKKDHSSHVSDDCGSIQIDVYVCMLS